MAIEKYFTLTTSDAQITKRFKVLHTGYRPSTMKMETINRTLNGIQDISRGAIYKMFDYIIKVREQEEDTDYGTLADLSYFFELNNPNGTPSDKLTMVDHYGNTTTCVFIRDFSPEPLGVMLEGLDAYFTVKTSFEILNVIELGSGS